MTKKQKKMVARLVGSAVFFIVAMSAGEKNILGVDPVCAFLSGSGV